MPLAPRQVALAAGALATAAVVGAGGMLLLTAGDDGPPRSLPAAESTAEPSPSASASPSPSASASASPSPSPSPTPPPVVQLTAADLRSAPVPSLCDHPAGRLRNGSLPGIPQGAGVVELGDDVVLGDLDGDGVLEAAAVVLCSTGNSPLSEVLVYGSGPELLDRVPVEEGLRSDVRGHEVRVLDGLLEVSGLFQDEDDARCCPSGRVVRQYRLVGAELERVPGAGLARSARITGDGWGAVQIGQTYDELARSTGLPVVLDSLEDGDPEQAACTYVSIGDAEGAGAIGGEGRVRALVVDEPGILTRSGVGVGDTEARVLEVYGDRARREPNEYTEIDDVYVAAGSGKVVRFELSDETRRVTRVHAGEVGYAALIEGCA